MKILIADDHPVVRHGLKQMLTGEPDMLVVGEAKNGNEALELARKLDWDVAILDYSMPGRSGLQLLGEIKREFPQRPVLILSMHPEELHARRVLKAGGAGYMNKESAGEELAAAIRKVVGGGKYVRAASMSAPRWPRGWRWSWRPTPRSRRTRRFPTASIG